MKRRLVLAGLWVALAACSTSAATTPAATTAAQTTAAAISRSTATMSMSPSEMASMGQSATPAAATSAAAATTAGAATSAPAAATTSAPSAATTAPATAAPATTAPTAAPTAATVPTGPGTTVAVTLVDTAIRLSTTSVAPGSVTFNVTNAGSTPHEFVVLQTTVAQNALPPDPANPATVMEPGYLSRVASLQPKTSGTLTLTLAAGSYVFICNEPAHYSALGMHIGFSVR